MRTNNDKEHPRILSDVWYALFEFLKSKPNYGHSIGKFFSFTMYGCIETASLLASIYEQKLYYLRGCL
ncbi:MAG: hypothetical protein SNJ70_05105 [Armatimonadota bacterium]